MVINAILTSWVTAVGIDTLYYILSMVFVFTMVFIFYKITT